MQVRTPAMQPRSRVRNDNVPGRHQTEQVGLGRARPAPHAGAGTCRRCGRISRPLRRPPGHFRMSVYRAAASAAPGTLPADSAAAPATALEVAPTVALAGALAAVPAAPLVAAAPAPPAPGLAAPAPPAAAGAGLSAGVSDLMSMRQPVRRAARRAFWPSLPMASDSW